MDNKKSDVIMQAAFCRAVLSLLVRRDLILNEEANQTINLIMQKVDNIEADAA